MHLRFRDLTSAVALACPAGHAAVLRCEPLRRGTVVRPFPTLYWLVCRELCRRAAGLERLGAVRAFEARLAAEPALAARAAADHAACSRERVALLSDADRNLLEERGWLAGLAGSGIAGTRDFARVKCLHAHLAYHLVHQSAVGSLIEERMAVSLCPAPDPYTGGRTTPASNPASNEEPCA